MQVVSLAPLSNNPTTTYILLYALLVVVLNSTVLQQVVTYISVETTQQHQQQPQPTQYNFVINIEYPVLLSQYFYRMIKLACSSNRTSTLLYRRRNKANILLQKLSTSTKSIRLMYCRWSICNTSNSERRKKHKAMCIKTRRNKTGEAEWQLVGSMEKVLEYNM